MPATAEATAKPKLARLRNVEIFAAGRHKGQDYTDQDLDDIVQNFNRFSRPKGDNEPLVKVPGVIGHEEEQELLANTGIPKIGTPTKLEAKKGVPCRWCDGRGRMELDGQQYVCPGCRGKGKQSLLLADFDEIPPSIAKLINGRAYDQVSAEVYDEPPEGVPGKGKMLRRVAFLGGDLPHIKSLADLPHADYAEFTEDLGAPPPARIRMSRVHRLTRGAAGVAVVFSEVRAMPLTEKGAKIKSAMDAEYGKKKGDSVFYASANKGTISGVHHSEDDMDPDRKVDADGDRDGDVATDPGAQREAVISKLAEKLPDHEDTLKGMDDKQLALMAELADKADREPEPPIDEYSEDELLKVPEDEGKAKLSERIRGYCEMGKRMYGEDYDPLTAAASTKEQEPESAQMGEGETADAKPNTDGEPEPEKKDTIMPSMKQMSESLRREIRQIVRSEAAAVHKELAPVKAQVKKFSEDTKRQQALAAIREGINAGRIGSWEMDNTGGMPTLLDTLMKADTTAVRKFSEKGKVVAVTDFDLELRRLQKRPVLYRMGELAKTETAPANPKDAEEASKKTDLAKLKTFCEQPHVKQALAKFSDTPESFLKTLENASPADRKAMIADLEAAAA